MTGSCAQKDGGIVAMSSPTQDDIRAELGVHPSAVPAQEARRRIDFLAQYLRQAGSKGYVLGISGGVDSLTVGRLCQLACEQLRADGYEARFVAMRLPYGQQADESDAQAALEFIQPDETLTVNIQGATDALWEACVAAGGVDATSPRADFDRGNVKARQRMVAQYAVAGSRSMLVVGTDHAAEAVVGFFTKFGDGACDLVPLAGLTKGQVRDVARHLGAPEPCVVKTPTADLETDKPLLADEAALGVTYDEIDAYLRGESVSEAAARTIESWHQRTGHKRALPVAPSAYVRQSLGKRV